MNLPFIPNEGKLDPVIGDPQGYVTKDGKWAAVPWGNKFVVICNGQQVHTSKTLTLAKEYIKKKVQQTPRKRNSTSSLEEHLNG
jgi:hypothetical protein